MDRLLLDPEKLVEEPGNENVMDEATYASLVRFVREQGFRQPVLVRPLPGGGHAIVDGAHRRRAAVEVGLREIPCEVVDVDAEQARVLRIGMNKHRGELDLAAVGRTFLDLSRLGWVDVELSVTGFSEAEVETLLSAAREGAEGVDVLEAPPPPPPPPRDDDQRPRPFVLEIEFSSRTDMQRAKRALVRAAGKGKGLGTGLLRLIE